MRQCRRRLTRALCLVCWSESSCLPVTREGLYLLLGVLFFFPSFSSSSPDFALSSPKTWIAPILHFYFILFTLISLFLLQASSPAANCAPLSPTPPCSLLSPPPTTQHNTTTRTRASNKGPPAAAANINNTSPLFIFYVSSSSSFFIFTTTSSTSPTTTPTHLVSKESHPFFFSPTSHVPRLLSNSVQLFAQPTKS